MDGEERNLFAEYIESSSNLQLDKRWYAKPELPGKLLRKENTWMDKGVQFSSPGGILAGNSTVQEVALRSVKIPAGIINWNPVEMTTRKSHVVPMPGGMFIDARGIDAPTPSANRMFIPRSQSEKGLLIPYWRVAIRHAVELMEDHGEPSRWAEWFYKLCQNILGYGGKEAVEAEREIITSHLAFHVRLNGRMVFLSKEEMLERFGSSVSRTHNIADGIVESYGDDITGYRTDIEISSDRIEIIGD